MMLNLSAFDSAIERARPQVRDSTLRTNHGRVVVIVACGSRLSNVDLSAVPTTFERLCVASTSGSSSCVVLLV